MSITSPSNSNGSSSKQRPNGRWAPEAASPLVARSVTAPADEEIAKRAYEKFLGRGGVHGFDRVDWDEARRELVAETIG